jgi:hypothetical protein
MVLSKNQFFGILFTLLFTPFLAYKIVWLYGSEKADGKMRFMGKTINGQMTSVYPVISFSTGADTVWFDGEGNMATKCLFDTRKKISRMPVSIHFRASGWMH